MRSEYRIVRGSSVGRATARGILPAVVGLCSLLLATHFVGALSAAEPQADTSAQARQDSMRLIPFDKFSDEARRKVLSVLDDPTLFRRMPPRVSQCDPDLHLCLVRNPELVAEMWKVMGASAMTVDRTGAFTWNGNDSAGTQCKVELIYGTDKLHVIYGDGFYEGPLFRRKINGRTVLVLKSEYHQAEDGRSLVTNHLDVFLAIDNAGADLMAKTLHPIFGSTADANFLETTRFITKVSDSAERNGAGMQRLADKLVGCQKPVREEFVENCTVASQRAANRLPPVPANRQAARK